MRTPPGAQILSISCSFWENLTKTYVGAPLGSWRPILGEILDLPLILIVSIKRELDLIVIVIVKLVHKTSIN